MQRLRYQKGFRLPKERTGALRTYFTERVSIGAVGSGGLEVHIPSTSPDKLLPQERHVEEAAEATARARLIHAVYAELHATRPKLAEVAWHRLELSYGIARQQDPRDALRELAGLARYTDAALERARTTYPAWLLAKKPWNTEIRKTNLAYLEERLALLQEESRASLYPTCGVLALFERRYLPPEPTLEQLYEVADDVLDRACEVASRNEPLLRAVVDQADRMLSEASRALDEAWTNVEKGDAVADTRRRKGDGKGEDRLARMARTIQAPRSLPEDLDEQIALVAQMGEIVAAMQTRDGSKLAPPAPAQDDDEQATGEEGVDAA